MLVLTIHMAVVAPVLTLVIIVMRLVEVAMPLYILAEQHTWLQVVEAVAEVIHPAVCTIIVTAVPEVDCKAKEDGRRT